MSVSLEIVSQQVVELQQHLLLLFLDFIAGILGRKTLTGGPGSLLRGWGGIVQTDRRAEPLTGVVVLTLLCPTERDGKTR